jgi:hypothetical protein
VRRDSLFVVACTCLPVWACDEQPRDRSGCNYFGQWRVSLDVADVLGPDSWHLKVSGSPGNENVSLTADGLSCESGGTTNPWTCAISSRALCKPQTSEFDSGDLGSGDLWTVDLTFTQTDGAWTGTGRWEWVSQQADDIASFGNATATK